MTTTSAYSLADIRRRREALKAEIEECIDGVCATPLRMAVFGCAVWLTSGASITFIHWWVVWLER